MPTATFAGTIKEIHATDNAKPQYPKRTMLLQELTPRNPQYPEVWKIEFQRDKTSVLDTFNRGDEVSCEVEITGREWKDTAFNTLKCFRITKTKAAPVAAAMLPSEQPIDDLPF